LRRNLNKPVSAKIRLLDPDNPKPTLDFVRALIKAGANAIAIHGRIVGDESHTMARWETLIEVVRQLKQTESVPIIVNGDLYTRADIQEMKSRTGCDGVMLARPALYNISIFRKGEESKADGKKAKTETDTTNTMPISEFQASNHPGYYGYHSPLLHSRTSIVQDYISHCVRYRAHSKNAKYVVCEMMNSRRAPTQRVPYLNMAYEGGQTIDDVCKCRNLDDLIRVWDVKWTIPLPSANKTTCNNESLGEETGDLHNYDDRYFLDADNFRKERSAAVDAALLSANDEKKTEECEEAVPATKRPKI
jgi:hypothetical protein